MSLLIRKHRDNIKLEEAKKEIEKKKREEKKEKIKSNSEKFIGEIEKQQNMDNEIIYLKTFWKILISLYEIGLYKKFLQKANDNDQTLLLAEINYNQEIIINLFNKRDLIFYLLLCRVFVYNGNNKGTAGLNN